MKDFLRMVVIGFATAAAGFIATAAIALLVGYLMK